MCIINMDTSEFLCFSTYLLHGILNAFRIFIFFNNTWNNLFNWPLHLNRSFVFIIAELFLTGSIWATDVAIMYFCTPVYCSSTLCSYVDFVEVFVDELHPLFFIRMKDCHPSSHDWGWLSHSVVIVWSVWLLGREERSACLDKKLVPYLVKIEFLQLARNDGDPIRFILRIIS